MRIEHVALWTHQLERLKDFYTAFFGGRANAKYVNPETGFESYFLTFDSGARLELMQMAAIPDDRYGEAAQHVGLIHLAFAAEGRAGVDALTEELRAAGCRVVSEARETGDGYYESCILDPDGNRVEIVADA